jgi:hypothetical protein
MSMMYCVITLNVAKVNGGLNRVRQDAAFLVAPRCFHVVEVSAIRVVIY